MGKTKVASAPDAQEIEQLRETVAELRDDVRFLTQAIDEFRTDFTHCLRNLPDNLPPPYAHLGTMFAAFTNEPPRSSPPAVGREEDCDEEVPVVETVSTTSVPRREEKVVTTALPTQVVAASNAAKPRGKKKAPLYMRIIQQPLLTDLFRAVGYAAWDDGEFQRRLQPLRERYSEPACRKPSRKCSCKPMVCGT